MFDRLQSMHDKLDQHAIVIRKRNAAELTDLALKMARREFFVLAGLFLPFAVGFFLFNRFLLGPPHDWVGLDDIDETRGIVLYAISLFALMVLELPFASSLMRCWLGLRTFSRQRRPATSEAFFVWFAAVPQLVVFHLLFAPIFFFHAYMPEVILLERTPFRRTKQRPSSTWRRSRQLHKGHGGEIFGFMIASAVFGAWFVAGLTVIVHVLLQTTFGRVAEERLDVEAFYVQNAIPPLVWIVLWFVAVLEFLRYIDLRIEKEGWDVDLAFRAERARMRGGSPFLLMFFLPALFAIVASPSLRAESERQPDTANIVQAGEPIETDSTTAQTDKANIDRARRSLGTGVVWRLNPWYSPAQDDFAPIPFPYERTHTPSYTPRGPSLSWELFRPIVYGLGFIALVLVLLSLYFLIRRALEKWFGADFLSAEARRDAVEKQRRIETLPVEAQAEYDNLPAAVLRAVRDGDWRGALILYFSDMLIELDRAECIRLHRGKTNHEYAWELNARADLRYYYSETMYLFEKVYFGDYPIDGSIFETVWKDRNAFRALLPRRS